MFDFKGSLIKIIGLTGLQADVDSQNRLKTTAEVQVDVQDLTGFDNSADTWFDITNAGGVGDTIRVQIAAPGGVDVTSTLTAVEAGDREKAADLVVADLNADSAFKLVCLAQAVHFVVTIRSISHGEESERPGAGAFAVTTTGTTTVFIPIGNDKQLRRNKSAEIFPSPKDERIGSLSFRGEVASTTKAERPIFVAEFDDQTSGNETRVVIDRDLTNIASDTPLTVDDDAFIGQFSFDSLGKQIEFIVGSGKDKGSQKTFLASEGGVDRDTYLVGDYVIKDHRGNAAPASFASNNGAVLVVEAFNGTVFELLNHTDYDIVDIFGTESDCQILITATGKIPPAGGDGIRINYAKLIRRFRVRVNVDLSVEKVPAVPIKITTNGLIVIAATQQGAGAGTAIANFSGFPLNRVTGET